ncbi:MAG: DNA polymerase Y family protein [Alphaproteobacteria bacterium]|nr:DNA polymerase Y family protein [Alphaproteobacteria bacterium]
MRKAASRRIVSLFLPAWPTDRLRRQDRNSTWPPPDRPLVTVRREGQQRVLAAADAPARRLGLAPGLPLADARLRAPGLAVAEADPAADIAGLERLAAWCLRRYSPIVWLDAGGGGGEGGNEGVASGDGLGLDVTGCTHAFTSEWALLADLVGRLGAAGISARAAIATTPAAAEALARFAPEAITAPDPPLAPEAERALLDALPVAALRLAPETLDGLARLGFATIGDLARTPRGPLTLRFGAAPLRRLDQAAGRIGTPLRPFVPAELVQAGRAFAEPIGTPEALAHAIATLTGRLCARLAALGAGARRLDLLFHGIDGRVQAVRVGLAQAARDAPRLARLLAERLEGVDPGHGIERMTLLAARREALHPAQAAALIDGGGGKEDGGKEDGIAALIDALANRLGAGRLYRAAPVESDIPERSVARIGPLAPTPSPAPASGGKGSAGKPAWPAAWPRPIRLLARPEPIETIGLLPDHPPRQFTWRGIRRKVVRADGPERIFGEWWQSEAETATLRDYFQVEDEAGGRFWLFRSGNGEDPRSGSQRWYLHGIFA